MTRRPADFGDPAITASVLCRDCFAWLPAKTATCPKCRSPRLLEHVELRDLSIAHIDCDAFYASIEKRDNPDLADQPVIVGGGRRGVVSTCCYIARIYGVRSAMPMFKALAACPDAVVIRPNMAKYAAVGRQVRELMRQTTPLVEPLSIDEAFLDLTGTDRLHHGPPARTLVRLVARIQAEVGISVSVGLSFNKFLAKLASDLDKPRGFHLIGQQECQAFLADLPVTRIWGVGKSLHSRLKRDGIATMGDLQWRNEPDLVERYGAIGSRLARFSRGQDDRRVTPESETKSISTETTFEHDLHELRELRPVLWRLCVSVSGRLKARHFAGRVVTVKLKTSTFRILTRRTGLGAPTQLAERLFQAALPLLERELDGRRFRLLGVGMSDLCDDTDADRPDLADPDSDRRKQVELTMDALRARLGPDVIDKGRSLDTSIHNTDARGPARKN